MTELVPSWSGPVRLRRFTPADVDRLVELDRDPEVHRFLFREPPSRGVVEAEILPRVLAEYPTFPGFGQWAAEWPDSGDFVGWFSLHVCGPDQVRRPELGYRLRRTYWGRGIATAAARDLLRWAFDRLAVDAVWAQTMAVNTRSRRVLERCGLRHVRTDHLTFDDPLPGTEAGEAFYEVTREEWQGVHR